MTRALRLTTVLLVVACLGGCATGESTTPSTLPPLTVPRVQAVRGVSLRETPLVNGPTAFVANDGGIEAGRADADDSAFAHHPTMLWLLATSGVLDEIGDQAVTILAPSEQAFRDFKFVDYYGLLADPVAMAPILRRHVVLGAFDNEELAAASTVTTLDGEQLTVWLNGRQLVVNEATVTLSTSDGVDPGVLVVYSTDRLLLLPEVSAVP